MQESPHTRCPTIRNSGVWWKSAHQGWHAGWVQRFGVWGGLGLKAMEAWYDLFRDFFMHRARQSDTWQLFCHQFGWKCSNQLNNVVMKLFASPTCNLHWDSCVNGFGKFRRRPCGIPACLSVTDFMADGLVATRPKKQAFYHRGSDTWGKRVCVCHLQDMYLIILHKTHLRIILERLKPDQWIIRDS